MHRLFVAIDMPSETVELLANICYGIRRVRWTPRNQLHMTVRFIGDCDEEAYHAIVDALADVRIRSFPLELKSVGYFPPRGNPRVLWVGISPSEELFHLRNAIEKALTTAGVERDERKFHPHITVARVRDHTPASEITPFLSANNLFRAPAFMVNEFRLYSSVLRPEGAEHRIEATYPLL